jgi:hypothetical protein
MDGQTPQSAFAKLDDCSDVSLIVVTRSLVPKLKTPLSLL